MNLLSSYSQSKDILERHLPTTPATLAASGVAGFFASFLSLPFDFIKTRLQKQHPDANGKVPYKGSLDCAMKVAKTEGLGSFYKVCSYVLSTAYYAKSLLTSLSP